MKDQSSHFGKITLPPVIIADIYKHSLVVMDDIQAAPVLSGKDNELSQVNEDEVLYTQDIKKEKEQIVDTEEEIKPITWLGGFAKKVLVLVNDKDAVHVGHEELVLLTKMLEALGLSIADIALLNTAKNISDHQLIIQKLPAKIILLFGVEPSSTGLPMRFPQFQVQNWNECRYLYSPSLFELNTASEEQKDLKQKLWVSLKKIFDK